MIGPDFGGVLAAAQRGDVDAFGRLWRDAHPALARYCTAMDCGGGEDAASETWCAALKSLHRFTGDERDFRAWLFTIARRKVIDSHRRRPLENNWAAEVVQDLPGCPSDPADVALERMSTQEALRLLKALPTDQAELILLRVVAGLDVARVAKLVGKSDNAVRVSTHRGLRRLAEVLASQAVMESAGSAFLS